MTRAKQDAAAAFKASTALQQRVKRENAAAQPEPLKVTSSGYPKQFWVEGRSSKTGDFDDTHASFSGYFGGHGPHLFAAAPDLLAQLIYLRDCAESGELPSPKRWAKVQSAIKKATGE